MSLIPFNEINFEDDIDINIRKNRNQRISKNYEFLINNFDLLKQIGMKPINIDSFLEVCNILLDPEVIKKEELMKDNKKSYKSICDELDNVASGFNAIDLKIFDNETKYELLKSFKNCFNDFAHNVSVSMIEKNQYNISSIMAITYLQAVLSQYDLTFNMNKIRDSFENINNNYNKKGNFKLLGLNAFNQLVDDDKEPLFKEIDKNSKYGYNSSKKLEEYNKILDEILELSKRGTEVSAELYGGESGTAQLYLLTENTGFIEFTGVENKKTVYYTDNLAENFVKNYDTFKDNDYCIYISNYPSNKKMNSYSNLKQAYTIEKNPFKKIDLSKYDKSMKVNVDTIDTTLFIPSVFVDPTTSKNIKEVGTYQITQMYVEVKNKNKSCHVVVRDDKTNKQYLLGHIEKGFPVVSFVKDEKYDLAKEMIKKNNISGLVK